MVSCKSSAQPEPDITGKYTISNGGDPQGGGALYLLPGYRFVTVFFGGAARGSWMIRDSTVAFQLQDEPTGIRVYGRYNPNLDDSIQIFFEGFDTAGSAAAIGFDTLSREARPVFNASPNCTTYPYVHKFSGKPSKVILAIQAGSTNSNGTTDALWHIYTYHATHNYNDFVARYTPIPEGYHRSVQPFTGKIRQGKLYLDGQAGMREPLSKTSAEMKDINRLLDAPADPENVLYNPYYKEAEAGMEKDISNYRFSRPKNAYISLQDYKEGEENLSQKDGDYNRMSVIYAYRKLSPQETSGQVKLNTQPVFTAKCP